MTLALQAQSKSLVRRFHFCQHPFPSSPAPDSGETKQDSCVTAVCLLRTQKLPGYCCIMNFMSCQRTELGPTACPLVLHGTAWGTTCPANAISCHKHVTGVIALSFQADYKPVCIQQDKNLICPILGGGKAHTSIKPSWAPSYKN